MEEKTIKYKITCQELTGKPEFWTREILPESIRILRSGGLIIFPTETSYMLGGDSRNRETMNRLRKLKGRPGKQSMSIMCHSIKLAQKWTVWPEAALKAGERYLPGPLTVIVNKKSEFEDYASTDQSIGIRIPEHRWLLGLLEHLDFPITATSANYHKGPEPYCISNCVSPVDLVWDAGELLPNPPSTIVSFISDNPKVIREGIIPASEFI